MEFTKTALSLTRYGFSDKLKKTQKKSKKILNPNLGLNAVLSDDNFTGLEVLTDSLSTFLDPFS